jgi:hypothetical protein
MPNSVQNTLGSIGVPDFHHQSITGRINAVYLEGLNLNKIIE